jgi:hypothetical protein
VVAAGRALPTLFLVTAFSFGFATRTFVFFSSSLLSSETDESSSSLLLPFLLLTGGRFAAAADFVVGFAIGSGLDFATPDTFGFSSSLESDDALLSSLSLPFLLLTGGCFVTGFAFCCGAGPLNFIAATFFAIDVVVFALSVLTTGGFVGGTFFGVGRVSFLSELESELCEESESESSLFLFLFFSSGRPVFLASSLLHLIRHL